MTIKESKYLLPQDRHLEESLDEKISTEYSGSIVILCGVLLHQSLWGIHTYWESFVGQIRVLKIDVAF